ncbi:transposase [Niveibacterium terrae]|uniref:transposase n=1 Tax=Niveibacterium terrae TaxID=3373598 RepID=UPI003A94D937
MSRLARLFVPGLPQIVTLRGNNRCIVFNDETDCRRYLEWLREALRETGIKLHAWVLMPDHLHFLLSAPDEAATGRLMQQLGRRYVRWFNQRHQRSGTLWEGRYRSTVVEPGQFLLPCYRYIESNPVRSGLVPEPAFHPWSSCRHHLGLESDPLVSDHPGFWALGNTPFDRQAAYRRLLEAGIPDAELERIRYAAHRGWLLGEGDEDSFDAPVSRRLAPLPKGRPRGSRSHSGD